MCPRAIPRVHVTSIFSYTENILLSVAFLDFKRNHFRKEGSPKVGCKSPGCIRREAVTSIVPGRVCSAVGWVRRRCPMRLRGRAR